MYTTLVYKTSYINCIAISALSITHVYSLALLVFALTLCLGLSLESISCPVACSLPWPLLWLYLLPPALPPMLSACVSAPDYSLLWQMMQFEPNLTTRTYQLTLIVSTVSCLYCQRTTARKCAIMILLVSWRLSFFLFLVEWTWNVKHCTREREREGEEGERHSNL